MIATLRTATRHALIGGALVTALGSCLSSDPTGLYPATPAATTVKFDFLHRPLPEIPLPNDLATRVDRTSATGLRINASLVAPTGFEAKLRELIAQIDGWGVMQPISIPFTGPLDIDSILAGHRDDDYALGNDVVYLVDIDRDSAEFGTFHHLDLGQGNYPVVLEKRDDYGPNDPRVDTMTLLYEEADEDLDRDGVLDPGEDTDADGVLDQPNYLPGATPAPGDLAARVDALMTFYERETHTLIAFPMKPLRERTTYAVVVTRRLLDAGGQPVGSPFPWIHHLSQTGALGPLAEVLDGQSLALSDVAFAFTYTTQSIDASMRAVRDGLYSHGVQRHLGDDFPAVVTEFLPLRDRSFFPGATKLNLLYGEVWADGLRKIEEGLMGGDVDTYEQRLLLEGQRYVDYFVMGSFDSPQLFDRVDAAGQPLSYNEQSWPADLDRKRAKARHEKIYFTLSIPRKEVSARGQGRTVPVAILNHGHGGNRFTAMSWSAYFCKHGIAVLAIDGPSHGIGVDEGLEALARIMLSEVGLGAATDAVFLDRAYDQNGDGTADSGADFWTAYLMHTRDMVRQYTLDLMQTVRVVRGFDGVRTWTVDADGDGTSGGLAGDFDGDGVLDIGADSPIVVTGGSLGGMMTMMLGALEPEVSAIAPLVGGGALATIGVRSSNGGAKVGFMIRSMAPIYLGTPDPETGDLVISTMVPDLIDEAIIPVASARGVSPGDTLVVENLRNRQRGCGMVAADGKVRASVESDVDDATRLVFYRGPVIVPGGECEVAPGAEAIATIDSFDRPVAFQTRTIAAGQPLVALAEGLGLRRSNPEFRRIQGIAQMVLDPGDPAAYARHLQLEPMHYAGTNTATGAHALMIFTEGDTSVPVSAGMAEARAAGMLDYLNDDPRYGMPANQKLLDLYVAEGVHTVPRYLDNAGTSVHIDVEDFSNGTDIWAARGLPRLVPPMRLGVGETDPLGGESAALFILTNPQGDHGFDAPGKMTDDVRTACIAACNESGPDPCGCSTRTTHDVGLFVVDMVGRYLAANGAEINIDPCQAHATCVDDPVLPPARAVSSLP